MVYYQKKKFGYKAGTAYIKINKKGEWLPYWEKNFYRTISHIFIAHPLDSNHYWVSFFTSHENIKTNTGDFIKNIKCQNEFAGLKFINSPFILKKEYLIKHVKISENFDSINDILKIHGISEEQKLKIYDEMVKNFKYAINPSYEEKIVKVLNIIKIGNKLTLTVKTRSNIWIIDENSHIFTNRKIDLILHEDLNVIEVNKNSGLFLNTGNSIVAGIAEIVISHDN